jgi:hypothetical protein
MASCRLPPKNISITVQDIPLKQKQNSFLSNYLVNRETDPLWVGNWLIYYLYLFYLFKKYQHTTSIYINGYDVYNMRIVLNYKIESHSDRIIEAPTKSRSLFFMQEPLFSYLQFIITQIESDCNILVIPLIIDVINVTYNLDGTTDEYKMSHKNVLIYKSCLNAFEHFEPYGDYFKGAQVDNNIKHCIQLIISYINRQCGKKIKLNSNISTSLNRNRTIPNTSNHFPSTGPQTLEFWAPEYTAFEKGQGYCVAWSLLFIELSLKYPAMSIKQLNKKVMEKVVEAILKHEGNPQPLAVNFSRRYLFLARNYCFYIISQIEFNYNFIFDDFIKETNAKNELISKVGKIYNQTDFVNYLLVINCLYTVEYNCITIGMDYKQHFQNLYNNYKRINGVYPQRSILNKPIMELKVPDFESENEFWAMLMMNLLTKLIEIERKKTGFHIVTVPSATNSKTRKQTHVYGSRYGVLVD